jgi:hypothetical protein
MSAGDTVEASKRLRQDAQRLADVVTRLDTPSSSYSLLSDLLDAQRSMEQVMRELVEWHRRTMPGVHFAEHHDESVAGVTTVVEQLDLAVQQAEGLQETLSRAYGGSSVVRWFDEEQEPDPPALS